MKKFLSVLLSAVLLFTMCFAANAQDTDAPSEGTTENQPGANENVTEYEGYLFIANNQQTATIVGINPEVEVKAGLPEKVTDKRIIYTVVAIGDYAFKDATVPENIIVPSEVKTIGKGAFENSTVKSVQLPFNIESIGESAFAGCELESIFYPGTEKQFEKVSVAAGNEILLEKMLFMSKEAVKYELFNAYGEELRNTLEFIVLSPFAVIATPAVFMVFPPLALFSAVAPLFGIGMAAVSLVDFCKLIYTCMFEI